MGRRHRRFDEKKVVRWPAHSPESKGGEFAPKHVPMPRWAMAVAARLPGAKAKKVARRGGAASGPAREPDLFDEGERRFKTTPTKRVPRERYEQTQLVDTSGGRQRPGQESLLDELGNIDTSSAGAPAPAGTPGDADVTRLEAKVETLRGRLSLARERRTGRQRGTAELRIERQLSEARRELSAARQRAVGPSGDDKSGEDRPSGDVARMEAYQQAVTQLDAFAVSDRGREHIMRHLGGLALGVSSADIAFALRTGLHRDEHNATDREAITRIADKLDRRTGLNRDDDPLMHPPAPPRPSRDPAVLYQQAVDYATWMNGLPSAGDPSAPRFQVRPSLTALQGLREGDSPRDVIRNLEREAQTHPEEWGGGREYLNRLAGFLSVQSTTLPKAEADKRRAARARWQGVFKQAAGDEYWRTGTRAGAGTQTDALTRLEAGGDPDEIAQDMRASARSLRQRAESGGIQDYDRMGVLAYGDAANRAAGLGDARQLDKLADAIQTAADDERGMQRRAISTVATPAFRKALVAKHAKMSRAQFDALPEAQRAQILAELEEVATSGDKRRAFRDSMGSLVRGAEAEHVTQARSLRSSLIAPARPTRDQEFDATVARLKAGDGDIPVNYSRAQLVALDQALGLGESSSGRPTTAKLRQRMQTALAERRRAGGGDLEGKSRTRQALIDDARPFGDFAAEAMELIGHRASRDVMAQRLAATAQRLGIYHWVSPTITALKNGNESTARGQLTRLLKRHGVELHSPAGEIGPLDRKRHEALSGGLGADVSAVEVVRPGYTITLPGGEQVTVKARVQTHEVGPDFTHLQAIRGAKTVTELRAYARDRGVKIPAYLKRKDDIRDWLANHFTAKPGEDPDEYAARTRLGGGTPPTPVRRALTGSTLKNLQPGTRVVWEPTTTTTTGDDGPMSGTTVREGRFMYIDWENGRRERINRSSARGQPDVFVVEQVQRTDRPKPPPPSTVRAEILKLKTNDERRAYLARFNFASQAEANRLAKALGARQTRISVDATLDAIVKHFDTGGARDHDAISRVMERDTPAGLVKQLRAATTQAEAERIIALTPNYRLAFVADKLGIPIDPDWDTPTARKAIARIVTERRRGGGGRPFVR
jgi:hypothetical protein